MSTPVGSSQWMYTPASGFYPYLIDQSLRFNDGDSAHLTFTPSSAGNRKTWTWSAWVKRSSIDSTNAYILFDASTSDTAAALIEFGKSTEGDNSLNVVSYQGSHNIRLRTSMRFRDVSSWYHIVVAMDTSQATSSDRVNIYVNGTLQTDFQIETYPAQNHEPYFNSTNQHHISKWHDNRRFFDGYMAEVHFIDGTALDATSFGETINGIWVPKAYSGSYGTNGFYLPFADSSAIGDDLSGNTNDWTANNLAAHDVVPDSPTNNFSTLNNIEPATSTAFSEGNLKATATASTWNAQAGTFFVSSGKWYAEVYNVNGNGSSLRIGVGIAEESYNPVSYLGQYSNSWGWYDTGTVYNNASVSSNESTYTAGDILGIGLDLDTNTVSFYKNGTLDFSKSISAGNWGIATSTYISSSSAIINFGQDSTFAGATTAGGNADANGYGDFKHAPPSGFLAMCSANLPEPTIGPNSDTTSDENFNTVLYTGDGTTSRAITGVGFQPDWVAIKNRSVARSGINYDVIRGPNSDLRWDSTAAEDTTQTNQLLSFDTDGFTVGNKNNINGNTEAIVAWNWKAGGTAVSNTDGSITSSVSANPDAGFSIVSWTGNATNPSTIGHGLSSAPEMIILKNRGSTGDWYIGHDGIGWTDRLKFNTTNTASSSTLWNNTAPTSSVFTISSALNFNGDATIAYCFHSSDVCKVGSYVGNGSADGTFVYTGHKVGWVMIKSTASGNGWSIYDSAREPINVMDTRLSADSDTNEVSGSNIALDFLSNGFKLRGTGSTINTLNQTYIYLAFAEAPAKYSNAR